MASRVAGKIKLQSVDELLGVPEIAGTQEIEIGRIHAFSNHPFNTIAIYKHYIGIPTECQYIQNLYVHTINTKK